MKFSVKKKLNLSRIDKEMWPYEDEVFGAMDADSLEEAQKKVDVYYAEREGYHRALSEARKAEATKRPSLPLATSVESPNLPCGGSIPKSELLPPVNSVPSAQVNTPPINTAPPANNIVEDPTVAPPNVNNQPPREFN